MKITKIRKTYRDLKDLPRRSAADKVLQYYMIKHLMLLKIQNMMDINVELLQ